MVRSAAAHVRVGDTGRTHVKAFIATGTLLFAAACSDGQQSLLPSGTKEARDARADGARVELPPPPADTSAPSVTVGTTQQKAQFADNTVISLAGMASVSPLQLLLTADINPVDINIFYVSDKTTDSGHQVGTVTLVGTISLAADETKAYAINWSHPAFTGNYGAIVLDSLGNTQNDVFQAYLQAGLDIWSVGGSVFTGGSYRIPYWPGTTNIFMSVTNQSDFDFDLTFQNVGGTNFKTITLPVLSTYLFNAVGEGWSVTNKTTSVQVTTTNGGTVALGGYELRGSTTKTRFFPVKAAPYP
jgi:hypothetical protein